MIIDGSAQVLQKYSVTPWTANSPFKRGDSSFSFTAQFPPSLRSVWSQLKAVTATIHRKMRLQSFFSQNYRNNPKNLQFYTLNFKREALKESRLLYKSNTWIGFFNYHRSRCTDVWQILSRVPVMTTENRKCKKTPKNPLRERKKPITTAQKHNKHKGEYIRKYNNSNNNTNKSIVRPSL